MLEEQSGNDYFCLGKWGKLSWVLRGEKEFTRKRRGRQKFVAEGTSCLR